MCNNTVEKRYNNGSHFSHLNSDRVSGGGSGGRVVRTSSLGSPVTNSNPWCCHFTYSIRTDLEWMVGWSTFTRATRDRELTAHHAVNYNIWCYYSFSHLVMRSGVCFMPDLVFFRLNSLVVLMLSLRRMWTCGFYKCRVVLRYLSVKYFTLYLNLYQTCSVLFTNFYHPWKEMFSVVR